MPCTMADIFQKVQLVQEMKFIIFLILFMIEASILTTKMDPLFHAWHLCSLFSIFMFYFAKASPIYLVDFSCYKPPISCRVPFSTFTEHCRMIHSMDQETTSFISKVLSRSGQSEQTYLPPALHYIPPKSTQQESIEEVHMVLFSVFHDLLSKTKLNPLDIDILIVNCSGFCPVPSLSSIIINKFSLKEDIKSFNLSGMGCSASALAVDLAQNILKTHKYSNVVVLSTEILSTGWYKGKDRSMMVLNCVFRMGSAAILISNKKELKKSAKYKLLYSLRTQRAFDDKGYYSAVREEDSDGQTGVTLTSDLLQVAGETLRSNISIIGAKMLPFNEKVLHGVSLFRKKFINKATVIYLPNFKTVIQHFCLPTSGKGVIKEIGQGLKLGGEDIEPALMTLHRFGNQFSSSLWYELAYIEAKDRVKEGDVVWQLGMGTGPKCNSLVWKCIRSSIDNGCEAQNGPWADTIHHYPVGVLAH